MSSNQRQIIAQVKFTYSPLVKAFEKQTKTIEEQGKKQIDAITNQNKRSEAVTNNKRLEALTNENIYKGIFDQMTKQKFDEIRELIEEINHCYLKYYFKGDIAKKGFHISIMV